MFRLRRRRRPVKPDPDSIRSIVIARAAALGYTAHHLAAATARAVSPAQVYRFFNGTSDLSSARLDALFRVLKLGVRPVRPPRPPGAAQETESGA